MRVARGAFLFDVGHIAIRGELAIASDHASTVECLEAEKSNQTHDAAPWGAA